MAVLAPIAMRQELNHLRRRSVLNAKLSLFLAAQFKKFLKRMIEYKKVAWRQRKTIRELMKHQSDQDATIADLKKRIEECDIKYSELTHTNQAVGGKAIAASAAGEASTSSQPLRHFSSQIKLDLSVMPIGTSRRAVSKLLPNMKPRKPLIKLPSLQDDSEPPAKIAKLDDPSPSTSNQSPKTKTQSTMAKIRGITNEIRHLTNLSKSLDSKLKRPLTLTAVDLSDTESKKLKLD